jgi:hypothetical protein
VATSNLTIRVKDHLLIPFGRPKWDISKITIASVSTDATYFSSSTPCAYIDMQNSRPPRLGAIEDCIPNFPNDRVPFDEDDEAAAAATIFFVHQLLAETCEFDSDFERRFLELYFRWIVETCQPRDYERKKDRPDLSKPRNDPWWVTEALLPLPQAHLYVHDPLRPRAFGSPSNMFKVDFTFWTGTKIVAVEVDGKSHVGDEKHITKDRMLQRAGVHVIHILNKELLEHDTKVMRALLPASISRYWEYADDPKGYPFIPF